MRNEFEVAFNEISELRALPADTVQEALKTALVSAYRRYSNASAAQAVEAEVEPGTGRTRIFVEKEVVDEVQSPNTEVDLEKARYYHPECDIGDTVMVQVEGTTKKFGRIAAQTAKQVILQKIREAERNALYEEYIEKEGDIVNGTVQSINSAMMTISLGRAEAIMPRAQQIPGERWKAHDKVRVYLLEVKRSSRGPQIIVSRGHRNMLRRLLEIEIPEIFNGQIEIKNIAREAGHRSKVAVAALQDGIDPVGACVGMRGIRIQGIVKELHDEKIDVIEWNPKQEDFIKKALSPARVTGVYLDDDPDAGRTAVVLVPDDQLSLAIGREGQNARLAAKLTGWRIDIQSVTESIINALDNLDQMPLMDLAISHTELLTEVGLVIEKRDAGRAIMPEEYRKLDEFANIVESKLQAARDEARQARIAEINAVKSTLPQHAFDIPVGDLDLPDSMVESLEPLENVGEIMLRFLIDERRLRRMLGGNAGDAALERLQVALDEVMMPEGDFVEDDEAEAIAEEAVAEETITEETLDAPPETVTPEAVHIEEEPAEPALAFPDEPTLFEDEEEALARAKRQQEKERAKAAGEPELEPEAEDSDEYFDSEQMDRTKKRKKDKRKRRQLVYDEETGEMITRRRRKGSRRKEDWEI
jgi:transcription termination/antitermination protein NusA